MSGRLRVNVTGGQPALPKRGLREAQRATVNAFLNGGSWMLAAEYVEVESGKGQSNRPQLASVLASCKDRSPTRVRNVAFRPQRRINVTAT
jgi:hypothetical protein